MELWQLQRRVLLACTKLTELGADARSVFQLLIEEYTITVRTIQFIDYEDREEFILRLEGKVREVQKIREAERDA